MQNSRIILSVLALCVLMFGTALPLRAAPYYVYQVGILPQSDSNFYLGTTTPSTNAWKGVITDQLCLTADSCRTTWPGGSSSSGVGTTSPFTTGQIVYVHANGTVSSAATTTLVAGTNVSFTGGTPIVIGSSPITINATGGGSSNIGTSTSETLGYVPFWTTSGATPALLSGGSANFTWDNVTNTLSLENGTTTATSSVLGYGFPQIVESGSTYYAKGAVRSDDPNVGAALIFERNATLCPLYGCGIWNYRSRGDRNTKAIVQNDDFLGTWYNAGFDGTDYEPAGFLRFDIDGTPGNNDMPGRLSIFTTPDGSNIPIERLTIKNSGNVGIGTTSPYALLSIGGNVVIGASSAGGTLGDFYLPKLPSALLLTGSDGKAAVYAGTSCTNQFVRSLSALGVATCATVANTDLANSTISGIALGSNLNDLTAGAGLTAAGTYNGSTARTFAIDFTRANSWTGLQNFTNASSTQFSAGTLSVGTTATTTISSNGSITTPANSLLTLGTTTAGTLKTTTSGLVYVDTGGGGYTASTSIQKFTASTTPSTTWTKPAGLAYVIVKVVGAGGGGGGVASDANEGAGAAGGGAGGYCERIIPASVLSATETVVVPAGGAAGAANGGNGGTNVVSAAFGSWCTASNGGGGAGAFGNSWIQGGAGGIGSGGDLNVKGGDGSGGSQTFSALAINQAIAGNGGSSVLGGGGRSGQNSNGDAGGSYGGGGGGGMASNNDDTKTGGAGANGAVFVYEYF